MVTVAASIGLCFHETMPVEVEASAALNSAAPVVLS